MLWAESILIVETELAKRRRKDEGLCLGNLDPSETFYHSTTIFLYTETLRRFSTKITWYLRLTA